MHAQLLAAKTKQEAVEITEKALALPFDRHHPLPKFLGGEVNQFLHELPKALHEEFHAILREELGAAGFALPIGGVKGSTKKWLQHFSDTPGSQATALNAVLKASRAVDAKYGTSLTQSVWNNLTGDKILFVP